MNPELRPVTSASSTVYALPATSPSTVVLLAIDTLNGVAGFSSTKLL